MEGRGARGLAAVFLVFRTRWRIGGLVEFGEQCRQAPVEGAAGEDGVGAGQSGLLEEVHGDVRPEGDDADPLLRIEPALATKGADDLQGHLRRFQIDDRGPHLRIGEAGPEHLEVPDRPAGDSNLFPGALNPRGPEKIGGHVHYHPCPVSPMGGKARLGDPRLAPGGKPGAPKLSMTAAVRQ